MRRVGKTTLLRHIQDSIPSTNKLFVDLENPANQKLFEEENYDRILDGLRFLGLDTKKKGYVFLDEIQFVRSIPSVVKYLLDHHSIKFFMTGSSSYHLKNLFTESLAGRKYLFELFPFSFREFLKARDPRFDMEAIREPVPGGIHEALDRHYEEYLRFGGFPGVVVKDSAQEKRMMLEDIFSAYFQLEVRQFGDFRKTGVVRDLMLLLMERTGAKLDVQKLAKELRVARETISNYVAFLEQTYFISLVRPFSRSRDTEIRTTPKVYLCDSGLVNHFSRAGHGALFENAVFSALRRQGEVNYYQRKSGVEIDFILDRRIAYEVKLTAWEEDVRRLARLSGEVGIGDCRVVSRRFAEVEGVTYGFLL